ncbi:Prefoldin subunit 6 [Didymosphaeria variabile]|uniref:Prefoldin subunit 6 n=1 Tax=Didymosphaeria variabile TaxID=1932322 RepID=A0A9W8XE29_9PLEO|nr:Prefoldin subunit 6 [Didymosphaeria variabile]KAJ4348140.1 Prefoldin subunit 6 [Didymosphaeria variabile]
MSDVQKKLQALSDDYQKLQGELSNAVEARQKLESQQQENTTVKKEFDLLDDDANIYKQIGPVLLKQDKTEAVMSVNGRLDFIHKEISRIEKQIKDIQDKSEKVKVDVRLRLLDIIEISEGLTTWQIIQIQSAAQQSQEAAA